MNECYIFFEFIERLEVTYIVSYLITQHACYWHSQSRYDTEIYSNMTMCIDDKLHLMNINIIKNAKVDFISY